MNELPKLSKLVPVNSEIGAYCDPVTGECYPAKAQEDATTLVVDPVCKMEVDSKSSQFKTVFQGQSYTFCSEGCKQAFERAPQKYLSDKTI
jgi:YHS domain-containing protein